MRFQKHLQAFTESLDSRGASPRTVETYGLSTRQFLGYLERNYPRIRSIQRAGEEVLSDYQSYLATRKGPTEKPLTTSTQIVKIRGVRAFFRFLVTEGIVLRNPTEGLRTPRERYQLSIKVLSQDEVRGLITSTKPRTPLEIRNRAIVELFYACGLRTSELCQLMIGDVDLKEQTATIVNGKGGRSRIVPIGQYASHYVELYLERARKYMMRGRREDPGFLFLSQRGNPFDRSSINKTVIKSVTRGVGIDNKVSCYSFRHAVASHLLANGVDVVHIAKLLGHRSLRTTQRYLSIEIGDLKRMHSLHHPRESRERVTRSGEGTEDRIIGRVSTPARPE